MFKRRQEGPPTLFDIASAPLDPAFFIGVKANCAGFQKFPLGKLNTLPDWAEVFNTASLATVKMGWAEEGLAFEIALKEAGSIELFIDTRDNKTVRYPTRFCHQFLLSIEEEEEVSIKEVTRFRGEETRPLADPALLKVERKRSQISLVIPAEALFGYDPTQFQRLGFTYRIKSEGQTQLFSTGEQCSIENNPHLWATLTLVKG